MELIIPFNYNIIQRNNISQIYLMPNFKLKKFLLINFMILLIISVFLYFYYLKINNPFSKKIRPVEPNNGFLLDDNHENNNYFFDIGSSNENENRIFNEEINYIKNKQLKSFASPKFYQITREQYLYEKQKQSIISNLMAHHYSGKWYSLNENVDNLNSMKNKNLYLVGNSNDGDSIFEFSKAFEMRTKKESIALTMKNKEGTFIDHWMKTTSYSVYQNLNLKINIIDETFQINGKFLTNFEKGEIFQTKYKKEDLCSTIINMTFPLIFEEIYVTLLSGETVYLGNIATLNPENFTLFMNSTCGFSLKAEGKQLNKQKEMNKLFGHLKILVNISIFSTILYIIGVIFFIHGLRKNEMAITSINLECIILISVWNFYIFVSNLYLAFKEYIEFFINFSIIGFCSLTKFIIFDSMIFYTFWRIKEMTIVNECALFRLKLRFYGFFFLSSFLFFILIPIFFTNYFYITFICMILWIPQIIHNIITKNRYGFPFIYILSCTFERIIYPYYFRGYKNNIFKLRVNNNFFIILILFVIISIVILLLQTFRGPRFMLSENYQSYPYLFYKNKDELTNDFKDIKKEECVICISPIIEEDKEKFDLMSEMEDLSFSSELIRYENNRINNSENKEYKSIKNNSNNNNYIKIETEEIDNSDDNNLLIKEINNTEDNKDEKQINNDYNNGKKIHFLSKTKIAFFKLISFLIIFFKKNLLFFYKSSANIHNKLYMLTPCKHIFHADCLEKWLEQKNECPNCRTSFENLI